MFYINWYSVRFMASCYTECGFYNAQNDHDEIKLSAIIPANWNFLLFVQSCHTLSPFTLCHRSIDYCSMFRIILIRQTLGGIHFSHLLKVYGGTQNIEKNENVQESEYRKLQN